MFAVVRLTAFVLSGGGGLGTDELMRPAHDATTRWIESGGPSLPAPQRFLSLHQHHGVHDLTPARP